MQSDGTTSKVRDRDHTHPLTSLSLSDWQDPKAPDEASYEGPYTSDEHYSWAAQSSLAPMQSSLAAYDGIPGYSSSYPTTSASSSVGGYEYRDESSATSAYSGYTRYDSHASIVSSTVPSSYGESSVSGWSDINSLENAKSSMASARSIWTDVHNTIYRQRPSNEEYQLPCEFYNLTGCNTVFSSSDVQNWMNHIEGHLQSKFPTRLRCWFCSEHNFDARETSNGDVRSNFNLRMHHIRDHIR